MTIEVSSIDQGKGIEVMCSGVIHGKEIIASQNTKSDDELMRTRYMVIDYSDVKESYVSPEEIKVIVDNDIKILSVNPEMFIVIVVANEIFRMMSSLYAAYAKEYLSKIKHFEARDEAQSWIKSNI